VVLRKTKRKEVGGPVWAERKDGKGRKGKRAGVEKQKKIGQARDGMGRRPKLEEKRKRKEKRVKEKGKRVFGV
jgi:hypothetical protein